MDEEIFILTNIPSLLLSREVKAKTDAISGEWTLHESKPQSFHSTQRNIEFTVLLVNDSACLFVSAKINRATAKLSKIKVEER